MKSNQLLTLLKKPTQLTPKLRVPPEQSANADLNDAPEQPPNATVVVKPAFASTRARPVSDAAKWIKEQNPREFTIQINASRERASVELFLKQSELPEPNVIFPFERNGATWYALVHGTYNSFARANAAMKNLPVVAQFHTPWIRDFENLQAVLKKPN